MYDYYTYKKQQKLTSTIDRCVVCTNMIIDDFYEHTFFMHPEKKYIFPIIKIEDIFTGFLVRHLYLSRFLIKFVRF